MGSISHADHVTLVTVSDRCIKTSSQALVALTLSDFSDSSPPSAACAHGACKSLSDAFFCLPQALSVGLPCCIQTSVLSSRRLLVCVHQLNHSTICLKSACCLDFKHWQTNMPFSIWAISQGLHLIRLPPLSRSSTPTKQQHMALERL